MSEANYNVANKSSLSGVLQEVLKNFALTLENVLPAVVVSHDRTNNIVEVRPAINLIKTDGSSQQRETIKLPIHILGSGIVVSAPLKAGDTGWIIASDRDISLFKQSLKVSNPNTYRSHKFSFGFFIPDKIKGLTINAEDNDAFLISTLNGLTRISIKDDLINIISNEKINVKSVSEVNVETKTLNAKADDVNVECKTLTATANNVNITGECVITGNLTISGFCDASLYKIAQVPGISGQVIDKADGTGGKLISTLGIITGA